ncbi:flavin-containing monooxygenase [Sciscionella sediminilitoris]|uniref:flavin-containing monooxygenase n=1 Tax=Sciscionella sediminilitoris TaxID=1445613 RepID=UPI0004DEDF5B|nr:NAD(P)/FAD-dependent oxidoreductase [Sciscionella sp. SE31]
MAVDEHVDVLIIGAGLSGIGAACRLRATHPGKSFAVLEARSAIGGTWDLFRYPGVRSDSDMFTLGYGFAPWPSARSLADGESIREYVRHTADEHGITGHIRFGHRAVRAEWSTSTARWTVEVQHAGETTRISCGFLFANTGYYRYDKGFTPEFPGVQQYTGTLVHPQHWPEDLDHAGKRVLVIGSGATAVTLVPELAETAEQVTMLQRSPSYVLPLPSTDNTAVRLTRLLGTRLAYPLVRWKHILTALAFFKLSRLRPGFVRGLIRTANQRALGADYPVDTHFNPRYQPWDQRLCFAGDGDLFAALRCGTAKVHTDTIETFTAGGVRLSSGTELAADIVITATGLNLQLLGGMELLVDSRPVHPGNALAYKGMMLSGVPNFALTIGYTNASWTLKADLVANYVCRLIGHMDARGYRMGTPHAPGRVTRTTPLIDLHSGYVRRSIDELPMQGPKKPWRLNQNYLRDVLLLRHGRIEDGMRFA